MAKALYGHLGHPSDLLMAENARLRAQVSQLTAELERLTLELAAREQVVLAPEERALREAMLA